MRVYCNPVNVPYAYQFKKDPRDRYKMTVNREAADPSMVMFQGKYYLFASMTGSVWVSEDMAHWDSYPLPENMPIYDYAPDVRAIGEYLYFTASSRDVKCSFYRTKDPIHGPYEEIPGYMDYWDPNLFQDDDGRLYFYWGCANATPIWGIELDPATMEPMGQKKDLIFGDPYHIGYERFGEDHCEEPKSQAEIDALFQEFLDQCGEDADKIPEANKAMIRATYAGMPYIEGAWMTKHAGKYYLQYACPGAEFNVYADGVYVADAPLGPFHLAENNPFSYKPGGFLPGAGHGSTMQDRRGQWWHTATMRISKNHVFERRVGIWPAGFDDVGNLYCNQRYGDWPYIIEDIEKDPWADPRWYLLSYRAKVTSSGCEKGHEAALVVDENVQTWWKAKELDAEPWLCLDLETCDHVHVVQINFADDMEKVVRIIYLNEEDDLIVKDELVTGEKEALVTWIMVTPAEAKIIGKNQIELAKDGHRMLLTVAAPDDVEMKLWSNAPLHVFDEPNPGSMRVGFETYLPANRKNLLKVTLNLIR